MYMKKRFNTWYLACVVIAAAAFISVFVIWKDYITSETKFQTDAVLMDIDIKTKLKPKNRDDPNRNNFNKYDTYYEYKLTWEFVNVYSEKKYSYYEERESSTKPSQKAGEKKTIFVYYNDSEDDYEIVDNAASLVLGIVGVIFIVIPIVGVIRKAAFK